MKTTQLIQLVLAMLVMVVSIQDTHAAMKRVRAAPKSRSDAEKRRLRYKQSGKKERELLSDFAESLDGGKLLAFQIPNDIVSGWR